MLVKFRTFAGMKPETIFVEDVLANIGIRELNEMQKATLEAYGRHDDIVLLSATGSGKTLAFLLPILQNFDLKLRKTQAIIVVPSRELAQQIEQVFKAARTSFKVTCCYGGHKREIEENNLIEPPALLIGTPGRLGDHIRRGNITTDSINTLILDEFDKSLELGFQEEMAFIIQSLPAIKKRLLISATEAVEVPAFVNIAQPHKLNFLNADDEESVKLEIKKVVSQDNDKIDTLYGLICFLGTRSTIVFCNHRDSVERTSTLLKEKGLVNVFYHGAMEQKDRDAALSKFRNHSANILVTTDLAARGLDIPNIRYIIHYHIPHTEDIFIHRNGRTARMDASGTAIVIVSPKETLPEYINETIPEINIPEQVVAPEKPGWVTLFIGAGKKDKVNKVDIVGFLSKKGALKKDDIGLIDVKDFFSFVAVRRSKITHSLHLIKDEKIKGKKVKIETAK